MPSASNPRSDWNRATATSVLGPKSPSIATAKPSLRSIPCKDATSSPLEPRWSTGRACGGGGPPESWKPSIRASAVLALAV